MTTHGRLITVSRPRHAYCNWNPVAYVDPDGRDWYSTDNNKQYHYSETIHSQQDLNNLHIDGNYLGLTYIDNEKYYSLFGIVWDLTTKEGQAVRNIDIGLIKYAQYQIDSKNYMNYYGEDISSPRTKFNIPDQKLGESFEFNYIGGKVLYRNVLNDKATIEVWPSNQVKPTSRGSFFGPQPPKAYHLVFMNSKRYDVVVIDFYTNQAKNNFLQKYERLLLNKK